MSIHRRRWPYFVGGLVALIGIALLVFRWDWLIPMVQTRASAALGRPVTITHLHVALGRTTHIEADGVTIGNPANWPGGGTFATVETLGLDVDALALIQHRQVVLSTIDLQNPKVDAHQQKDGTANWTFATQGGASSGPAPQLGELRIKDGHVHVVSDKLRANFEVALETKPGKDGTGQVVAQAKGTYAEQPITATFTGGALLTLRDASTPYPVDLKVQNGPTHVALVGTVADPLAFAGARLKLELSGPDMSLLLPLTGVAIPKTPPYRVAGGLDYAAGLVKFDDFTGKVGSSDLSGSLQVDTKPERPVLTADMHSRLVDLRDLGGFIGAEPGDAAKGTKAQGTGGGRVIPDEAFNIPKLNAMDVHLKYKGDRIEGRNQPLDTIQADLDIVDGAVRLHPLVLGIGHGRIVSDITASEVKDRLRTKATIDFQRVDVARLLNATGVAKGAGSIGGRAVIEGTGRSMAEILGFGNGELKLFMGPGGNISAILVDLSGLQFGNALLSGLGIPNRAQLQCMAVDFVLKDGLATARTAILDTDEDRVAVQGWISLNREMLGMVMETDSKHFSVGSLPTPIDVGGTFAHPTVAPQAGPLAVRAGAAIALGIIGTPLAALLPTIQFGTGEDGACHGLLRSVERAPTVRR